jgi:hypothetical protein
MEGTRMTTQAVITDQRAGVYRSANREYDVALELMPPDRYVLTTTTGSVRREGFDGERTILESRELPAESPWTRRETNSRFSSGAPCGRVSGASAHSHAISVRQASSPAA